MNNCEPFWNMVDTAGIVKIGYLYHFIIILGFYTFKYDGFRSWPSFRKEAFFGGGFLKNRRYSFNRDFF